MTPVPRFPVSRRDRLVSASLPAYCGLSFVELNLLNADVHHSGTAAFVGGGSLFALGDGKGFLGHREFGGNLALCAALTVGEDWLASVDSIDTAAAKTPVLDFDDWDASLWDRSPTPTHRWCPGASTIEQVAPVAPERSVHSIKTDIAEIKDAARP